MVDAWAGSGVCGRGPVRSTTSRPDSSSETSTPTTAPPHAASSLATWPRRMPSWPPATTRSLAEPARSPTTWPSSTWPAPGSSSSTSPPRVRGDGFTITGPGTAIDDPRASRARAVTASARWVASE